MVAHSVSNFLDLPGLAQFAHNVYPSHTALVQLLVTGITEMCVAVGPRETNMRATKLSFLVGCFIAGFFLLADPAPAEAAPAVCNDDTCHPSESCPSCPECCICGDGSCDGDETCATCSSDCGSCAVGCGDGICDAILSEDCSTCDADCGECLGYTELTDFATCPKTLVDCDASTTSCCKRPFGSFNGRLPLLIPTDRCHQPITDIGDKYSIPAIDAPKWCSNPGLADPDLVLPDGTILPGTGMIEAFGLVYRAMQAGIPVYWAVSPTKDPQSLSEDQSNLAAQTYSNRDVDFWILSPDDADGAPPAIGDALTTCGAGCRSPIVRLNSDLTAAETYDMEEFPLRGGAFIIAAADRDEFDALFTSTGDYSGNAGSFYYDFSSIDIYEVQDGAVFMYQDFQPLTGPYPTTLGAPIAVTMENPPPRLAVQEGGPAELWLARARLNQEAATGCEVGDAFSPSDAIYCNISNTAIENNQLRTGNFSWAWLHGPGLSCDAMDELDDFMTAEDGVKNGYHIMFMEKGLDISETCATGRFLGDPATGMGMETTAGSAPYILRYPSNLIAQVGDVPAGFASGSPAKWNWLGSIKYQAIHYDYSGTGSLVRLVSEDASTLCTSPLNKSTVSCDVFDAGGGDNIDFIAYVRHKSNPANGIAFYAAGNNVNPRSTTAHLRMTLNAFLALPTGLVDSTDDPDLDDDFLEVTRSAPVIVTVPDSRTLFQGTFGKFDPPADEPPVTVYTGVDDASSFRFPHTPGHFRAFDIDAAGAEIGDVSDDGMIPAGDIAGCGANFSATCRTIFTNTDSGALPTRKFFVDSNASDAALQTALGGSLAFDAADTEALMGRILEGWPDDAGGVKPMLGGVDRSTSAIIGTSPLAEGGSTRPQIAYFGALDGGLHAVCTEAISPCSYAGQELWMYIPRTQLPKLRLNTQRVDGSPNVSDLFADFDGDGSREWRTILVFQTGSGTSNVASVAPVVVAIDITNPGDPIILWDKETSGLGLTMSTGPVRVSGVQKSYTFAAVNRGAEPDSGLIMTAIDVETGLSVWTQSRTYSDDDRGDGNASVPTSAIPSGAAGVDIDGTGSIANVAVTTLFGDLWLLSAVDGTNDFGTDPLFRFSSDFHPIGVPPVLYRRAENGRIHAIVASGGYGDPFETAWSPDSVEQWAVGVWLESPVGLINEDPLTDFGENRSFTLNLGAGNRVFAQPVVSGDNIFIVTDNTDINLDSFGFGGVDTGSLVSYSLSGLGDGSATPTTTTLASGGGGVDVTSAGEAIGGNSGGSTATITNAPSDFNSSGTTVEMSFFTTGTGRQVWLRLQ